jgi:hypothetical protein
MGQIDVLEYTDEAMMLRHCAPIFFLPSPASGPSAIASNGTVALLDTGQKKILVTCSHVWEAFQKYRDDTLTGCLCTVFANGPGWPVVIPGEAMIDSDAGLDLVVFEARPAAWNMGYKEFYRIDQWPIPKAKKDDPVGFIGFPGKARQTGQGIGNFGYASFGLGVSDVSDRGLVIARAPNSEGHLVDNDGKELPPLDVGGLSGSPAYVRDRKARFLLAGFVRMGATTSDDIFLTHAAFLNRDGTLKHCQGW